jgi:hypothetical protein
MVVLILIKSAQLILTSSVPHLSPQVTHPLSPQLQLLGTPGRAGNPAGVGAGSKLTSFRHPVTTYHRGLKTNLKMAINESTLCAQPR